MKVLETCLAETGWPGATVSIAWSDGREEHFAAGMADRERSQAMDPRNRLFAGSIGKTFAATAAMILVEAGRISLDEPITAFEDSLPWIATLPRAHELTLRRVMAHRTGLADFIYTEGWRERWAERAAVDHDYSQTIEEGIRIAVEAGPICAPDTETKYADTNYLILGRLIEAAAGSDYYEFLKAHVLEPHMLRGTTPTNTRRIADLAPGYLREGLAKLWGPKTIGADGLLVYNPSWEFCGGGLASTAADLARFMKRLMETKIVSAQSLGAMKSGWPMEFPLPNHRYGLGLQRFDTDLGPVCGHAGQFAGYRALAFYFEQSQIALAMQVNADVEKLMPTFMVLAQFAHQQM